MAILPLGAYTTRMARPFRNLHDLLLLWLPLFLWLCFIFSMSTGAFSAENTSLVIVPALHFLFPWLAPDRIDALHALIRKGAHLFEYFVLGLLILRVLRAGRTNAWKWRWCLLAVVVVALWACGDEFHQSFEPTRTASMRDVAIDTVGGIIAQFAAALWYVRPRREKS